MTGTNTFKTIETKSELELNALFSYSLEQKNSAIIAELLKNNFVIRDSASGFYDINNDDTLHDRNLALKIFEKCGYSWNSAISLDQRFAAYLINAPSGNSFNYYVDASSEQVIDLDDVSNSTLVFDSLDDLLIKSKNFDEIIEIGFYLSLKEGYA